MNIAALFSGGKDSTLTVYKALQRGHTVKYLISMISENPESYMFHHPNIWLTRLQAESMGISLLTRQTKGEKETELADLEAAIASVKDEVDAIAAGALASRYQYDRVRKICDKLGLQTFTPQWQVDPEQHWQEIFAAHFRVIITDVACDGLDKSWLGREIDQQAFEELKRLSQKYRFHLGFEGGEAETLVTDAPVFKKRIQILDAEKIFRHDSGHYLITKAELTSK